MQSIHPNTRQRAPERAGYAFSFGFLLVAGMAMVVAGQRGSDPARSFAVLDVDDRSEVYSAAAEPIRTAPLHSPSPEVLDVDVQAMVRTYCVTCHNRTAQVAGMVLDTLDATR